MGRRDGCFRVMRIITQEGKERRKIAPLFPHVIRGALGLCSGPFLAGHERSVNNLSKREFDSELNALFT